MHKNIMNIDNTINIKEFGLNLLEPYWGNNIDLISNLPIKNYEDNQIVIPVKLKEISLPKWASHCGVNNMIPVPLEVTRKNSEWQNIDWWYVIYWYANSLAERKYENIYGPIHSYSYKLKNWDKKMWDHAWVNRIAMFLYCWSEFNNNNNKPIVNNIPKSSIYITHDLDAVNKTHAIRFKQSIFIFYNALKELFKFNIPLFFKKTFHSIKFFFSSDSYFYLDKLNEGTDLKIISKKIINIYGGKLGFKRSFKEILIDPSYDISDKDLVKDLLSLANHKYEFGLHQSCEAWKCSNEMKRQMNKVSNSLGLPIKSCRQHWLRFSFKDTWLAQYNAGFSEDTTLGFNDRIGFRNGLALGMNLNLIDKNFESGHMIVPMVLMDSHLYDYLTLNDSQRKQIIKRIIDEVRLVGGKISIIWHQHTLGSDYGWESGYKTLLEELSKSEK